MYNLALDFERKRQFNMAQSVYAHMAGWNRGFKDLQSKVDGIMDHQATPLEATVHVYRGPGYDPRHKTGDAAIDDFARTALIRKPAAPGFPGAEDDKDIEG